MKTSIYFIFLFFYLFISLLPSQSLAGNTDNVKEIAVVVNPENPVKNLTSKEISDMFLSRRRTFPSGDPVMVLEQDRDSSLREKFFRLLNGMTLKRVNTYWVRLQFSGEVQPPPVMSNNIAMIDAVRNNRHAIGYVPSEYVDESVHVILILKD
ncbi:MAG: hypothetical protein HQK70_07675 [Desulfamplus sp.]|nr:hypothetical protein [Desulfamplus sp.]